jgi:maltoporin
VWKEGDKSFYFDTNVAYSVSQQNDWESTSPAFREANVQGKNLIDGCQVPPSGPVSASINVMTFT